MKQEWTADQINTIINGIIFRYSHYVGMSTKDTYENMDKFFKHFQKEINKHEESIQLGQDDQITA